MVEGLKRWFYQKLRVPPEPQPPDGTPESIRTFRAGRNYYRWRVIQFALGQFFLGLLLAIMISLPLVSKKPHTPNFITVWTFIAGGVAVGWALAALLGVIRITLDYEMRWYIVTDRSLRIRSGIWSVNEMTMTFANVQEIQVRAGPLQKLFGLTDVVVSSAGGSAAHPGASHAARFAGVDNGDAIRDLITERLRQYRDTGLGDPDAHKPAPLAVEDAARALLAEVRALRAAGGLY
jgi:membrane protein YdbS with pleckstrin-like domain